MLPHQSEASLSDEYRGNIYFELGIIKTELDSVTRDIRELRQSQKELLEFMNKIEGGKTWVIAMFLIASSISAIFTSMLTHFIKAA
jgi:hypothetical protein